MADEPHSREPARREHEAGGHWREPDEETIRARAHAIWLSEGMPEGREVDHWMRARRELEHEAGRK
jgi:hypothetical protein